MKSKRIISILLTVVLLMGIFVIPASAAQEKQSVTEYFVDSDGVTIAEAVTSTAEAKNAPDVSGYVYSSQSTKTTHVYAEEHIQYIIGYPDGSVRVEQNMCRSEAVVVLYRLYNGNYPAFVKRMSNDTFADVTSKAWFYKELETLYNVGIIDDDEYFRPDDPITRAEFAIMCAKYDGLSYLDKAKFSDVNPGHWAYSYINAAAEKGWIKGYTDGTFKPDNYITRAEVMSLVNRLFNRPVTLAQLPANVNPYNDITESHWAYCDAMEATVKHDTVNWHGATYNNGVYNTVIEKFMDTNGKEIAKSVTTTGQQNYHPTALNGHSYLGYITEITYVYTNGATVPGIEKTASVSAVTVGDTIKYTIALSNDKNATDAWRDVVVTDAIPEHLSFVHGSVYIGSKSAEYSFADGVLSVVVGNVEIGKSVKVSFLATVLASGYGKTVTNEATGTGGNGGPVTDKDDGIVIADGKASMSTTKSINTSTAKVGDTLTYTITATNADTATANLKNVVMTDTIPEYLTFTHGSVQVDGYSAKYSYDNESKNLTAELGDIAPGQTKTVTFTALVNSSAYGKTFKNTAILSADNDTDKPATDGGVTVENGTAEGSVGAKTVSSSTAKVVDTLTYTITLRNASTATAAWTGVEVADVIPEHLSFVSGSVEEDGRASTNYSYSAGSKTLTLFADSIGIGETKVFTFKVAVQDGAQGMYIVNTAVVSSDGREDIQLPDTGVQIDAGDTVPYMTKTASVSEARAGDIFTYTVIIKNGMNATAAWKDVILSDVLPTGTKLVSGSVTLNGQTVSYGVAGQAIEVTVGDLKAGAEAIVTFDVRVLESAEGTTVHNVAVAKGDNGEKTATDDGVTVPEPELQEGDAKTVTGSKSVDKTLVNTGDKVTYTITAKNNTEETWTGVQIYDVLDSSMLTLIDDSIYIDGVRFLSGSSKWTFADRQLVITLGDIEPGKEMKVSFQVQIKNDAANSTYINHATILSTNNDSVYIKAPEIIISGGNGKEFLPYTDIHYKLFTGAGDDDGNPLYLWLPTENLNQADLCRLGYRLMTDYYRGALGNGTVTVPDSVKLRESQFMISHGVISAEEYKGRTQDATQSQIYRVLNFAVGAGLTSISSAPMTRAEVASLVCDLTGRDKTPTTNGLPLAYFTDKASFAALIDEVSNSHEYTLDSSGNETWIAILSD